MDAAGASCSSVDAVARELLMATLEELSQEQLKRFRHKLRDAPLDGRSIPWGRLERSDAVDLVDKLIEFYEPVPAVEMTRQVLKRSDIRDVASRLKQQQLQKSLMSGLPSRARPHLGASLRVSVQEEVPRARATTAC